MPEVEVWQGFFNPAHILDPVALLREAFRVLMPAGTLAVIHWNVDPAPAGTNTRRQAVEYVRVTLGPDGGGRQPAATTSGPVER